MNDLPRGLGFYSARCSDEGHCITCSDEGVAMRVLEVGDDGLALCVFGGDPILEDFGSENAEVPVEVQTDLVAPVMPGDELLVHAGVALLRLSGGSVGTEAAA